MLWGVRHRRFLLKTVEFIKVLSFFFEIKKKVPLHYRGLWFYNDAFLSSPNNSAVNLSMLCASKRTAKGRKVNLTPRIPSYF